MDIITLVLRLAESLGPAIGIVGILGFIAAGLMYRDNNRLRTERNAAVDKAVEAARLAVEKAAEVSAQAIEKKDNYIQTQTSQMIAIGQKSTDALLKVSYALDKNTKSNDKLSEAVYTVLKSNPKSKKLKTK